MKVKEEHEKVGLKLNIQKTKIMASSLITSWQIDGETMETVTDLWQRNKFNPWSGKIAMEQLIPCASITEPKLCNQEPQLLSPHAKTTEAREP